MTYTPKNQGETAFIDQYTRKLTVDWALCALAHDGDFAWGVSDERWVQEEKYRNFAQLKGWINLRKKTVTGKGFKIATSFLRR